MKTLLAALFILATATLARAQTVSNVVVTCVIQLDNGLNFTNSVNSKSATTFASATNSMNQFNLARASQDPPKAATTNLSNYFIEFTKTQFSQYATDFDVKMQTDLAAKTPVMTQTSKDIIRAEIAKY